MLSAASNCDKFLLLLWKNLMLQWRHKVQLVFEVLVPVVFSMLLVLIRSLVKSEEMPHATHYSPCAIDDLTRLRNLKPELAMHLQYRLAYTPPHAGLAEMLVGVANTLKLKPAVAFTDQQQLQIALSQNPFLAGLEFSDAPEYNSNDTNALPRVIDYAIRFPGALRTGRKNPVLYNWFTKLKFPILPYPGPRNRETDDDGIPSGYWQEGFLSIQNTIAQEFVRMHSGGAQLMPEVILNRYPYPPYISDKLLTGLESIVPLIIMLSFVYPCTNTVKFIAAEKERQLKEAMKIMGLPNWLHWTSWFVRSMLFLTISTSVMVILLKIPWYPGPPVSVFTYSSWSAIWFFFFVYNIVTCAFCFMLSVFFTKANTAAAVSGLMWFLFFAPYTFIYATYVNMSLYSKLFYCIFSNTGMAFGFKIIIQYEGTSEGLQWSNIFKSVSVDDSLTVGYVIVMLLVVAFIYFLIALYVEKIYPGEYGVAERWWFPFSRTFWCGSHLQGVGAITDDFTQKSSTSDNFEKEPKHMPVGVEIRGLHKIYANKKIAVDSMSLNMYENQITVLLGHNGAGKSTTMAMLTGMLPPTSGTAIVNGIDICEDLESVRNSLGLCPQHNILFDELTVEEHLEFYSRLKGMHKLSVKAEIQKYLRIIQLEDKRHALSSQLSGGMKRKLSVCVAFCGGSKVVLCDEPTSGMDPAARRALWGLLQTEKIGRTVLLSTHFMDEADILGDRIAIMSNGVVRACGSSYFLKKRFGVGYHLVCEKRAIYRPAMVTALLQRYVSDVKIEHDIGTELSYLLTDSKSNLFPVMLDDLDRNLDTLGLASYGISMSTLEEVFMAIGSEAKGIPDNSNAAEIKPIATSNLRIIPSDDTYVQMGCRLGCHQIVALFVKKYLQTRRRWLMLLIQISIPAIFIIITVLSERSRDRFSELPRLPFTFEFYKETVTVLQIDSETNDIGIQYKAMFDDTNHRLLTVIGTSIEDYILDVYKNKLVVVNRAYVVGASILGKANSITAWFNNQPYHAAPLAVNLVHNAVLRARLGEDYGIRVTNSPMPFSSEVRRQMIHFGSTMGFQLAINVAFAMAFVAAFYVLTYMRERTSGAKLLQMVSGARVHAYWLTAFVWDYLTFMLTSLILLFTFAIFQEKGWSTPFQLARIFVVLMLFGWAVLPFTYIALRFFTIPASGYTRVAMLYIFTGLALFSIIFIMSLPTYDLVDKATFFKRFFLVFPHFALSNALNNININVQNEELCRLQCLESNGCTLPLMCSFVPSCCSPSYYTWAEPGIGRDFTYLFVMGFLAVVVLLVLEYGLLAGTIYAIKSVCRDSPTHVGNSGPVDEDVLEERHRIQSMSGMEVGTHRLVVKNVSKCYGKFLAVNQLSIGVDASECFGLLGVNGAGKTSTFKMLTGDTKISSGEAWVNGTSLLNQINSVHKIIGYCPQFDALIDELTGRETLRLFCRLRGVPERRIQITILELSTELNFVQHLDKQVRAYSGGTKRKLSTAVALIGNPVVVYLDEPTTGMDPGAKRCLWNVINKVRQTGKSIVLTSHSMDECEALCTRIAIMVNGEFKCLGSVQHLKGKYSNGFKLTIRLRSDMDIQSDIKGNDRKMYRDLNSLQEHIRMQFQGAVLNEEYYGLLTYHIPRTKDTTWSRMFGAMEDAKRHFDIVDYSLHQVSLEQVFLSFAKYQRDESYHRRGFCK